MDFETTRDFYYSCELMRLAKKDVPIDLLRHGQKMRLMVVLGYASYTSVEQSPELMLGFIAQELPGDQGLRIGNVVDGSGADRAGLRLGDRIALIDAQKITSFEGIKSLLDSKLPGETIAFTVLRKGKTLRFAYSLVDKEKRRSKLAVLSEPVRRDGQELTCTVTLELPENQHVYSIHKKGFGLPPKISFRGSGFELLGPIQEASPRAIRSKGQQTLWIHEGRVAFKQRIRVTNATAFHLYLDVSAEICDESTCHVFRGAVESDKGSTSFSEFVGRFEDLPPIGQ